MQIKPLGKIVLLILVLGLAIGGFRFWQGLHVGATRVTAPNGTNTSSTTSSSNPSTTTTATSFPSPASNEIELVTSASKTGWINDQIAKFNAQNEVKVVLRSVETREAMHAILDGKMQPALWSPSSVIWADRLAQVQEQKNGRSVLDTGDNASYRVPLRTPIVFLTTQDKAKFLRPLLSTSACWTNIQALSTGKKPVPWGRLKWAHADPVAANSGMLTLALVLADYADRANKGGAVESVAQSAAFLQFLKSLESRIVVDTAVKKGSSALVKSFVSDPSRYDFITAYESAALDAVSQNPQLAVIYPNPTINAESAVALLNWPSLSDAQKTAAKAFLDFVSQKQAAQDGLKEHFRPLRGASLESEIGRYAANGFRQSYSAIEVPPYTALNAVAYKWVKEVAGK